MLSTIGSPRGESIHEGTRTISIVSMLIKMAKEKALDLKSHDNGQGQGKEGLLKRFLHFPMNIELRCICHQGVILG